MACLLEKLPRWIEMQLDRPYKFSVIFTREEQINFVGQLTWQCGDVDFLEIGIKMRHGISDAILKDIDNITSELRKKHLKNLKNLDIERKSSDSAVKTYYDIYLYRVGNANTTYVLNTCTNESLLVDCGIEK